MNIGNDVLSIEHKEDKKILNEVLRMINANDTIIEFAGKVEIGRHYVIKKYKIANGDRQVQIDISHSEMMFTFFDKEKLTQRRVVFNDMAVKGKVWQVKFLLAKKTDFINLKNTLKNRINHVR